MVRRVLMASTGQTEVRLDGWCDKEMQVKAAPILLGAVFFRTALQCSGSYHLEMGGMPLHDSVGINCKEGSTAENQGAGVKYVG